VEQQGQLKVTLSGELSISFGDQKTTTFGQKVADMLIALALNATTSLEFPPKLPIKAKGTMTRGVLAELLWKDIPQDLQSGRMDTTTYELNKVFQSISASTIRVVSTPRGSDDTRIDLEQVKIDGLDLYEAYAKALRRPGLEELTRLEDVIGGIRGRLVTREWFDASLNNAHSRMEELIYSALCFLARHYGDQGDAEQAIEFAKRALSFDDVSDDAHEIIVLARSGLQGNSIAALEHIEQFFHVARKGGLLSQRIMALRKRLRAGKEIKWGEDEEAESPSKFRSGWAIRSLDTFVGRTQEMKEVLSLITRAIDAILVPADPSDRPPRVITLVGPAGIGKTRFAIELASILVRDERCIAWLAELSTVTDATEILPRVARSLRPNARHEDSPLEQITEALADQPALVILDNFEHLVEQGATVVLSLLSACPSLVCLVTSQERLEIRGEQPYPIEKLAVPAEGAGIEEIRAAFSVQLFESRAKTAKLSFQLTGASGQSVAELCRGLDGLPLALELAAARIDSMSPQAMVQQLAIHSGWLRSNARDRDPRHGSLSAAFEWSYNLLGDDDKAIFAQLSVFSGGWEPEAGRAVCASADASERMEHLLRRSLVIIEQQEEEATPRYGMLATMQQFAAAKLTAMGMTEEARERHASYYARKAKEAKEMLQGREQFSLLRYFDTERDNIQAALRWLHEQPGKVEDELALVVGVARYWELKGTLEQGYRFLEAALRRCKAETPARLKTAVLDGLGNIAILRGNTEAARIHFESSLRIRMDLGDEAGEAISLSGLAYAALEDGNLDQAFRLHRQVALTRRKEGRTLLRAYTLHNLGHTLWRRGRLFSARRLLAASLHIKKEVGGDDWAIGQSFNLLGVVSQWQEKLDEALTYLQESEAISRRLGDASGLSSTLLNLGEVERIMKNYDRAYEYTLESLAIHHEYGIGKGVTNVLLNLALICIGRKDLAGAREYIEQVEARFHRTNDRKILSRCIEYRATIAKVENDFEEATRLFEQALHLHREVGYTRGVISVLANLGMLACQNGNLDRSGAYLAEALLQQRNRSIRHGTTEIFFLSCVLLVRQCRWLEAARLLGILDHDPMLRMTLEDDDQPLYDQLILDVHTHLTLEEYTEGFETGKQLSDLEAIDLAISYCIG